MTSGGELPFVDFGRSYLIGNGSSTAGSPEPVEQNDVRLQVESLVRLYDGDTSLTRTIYQCAACKAENTFDATGPGDLFKRPNYDFLPAACGSELLIFRRGLLAATADTGATTRTCRPSATCARTSWPRRVWSD